MGTKSSVNVLCGDDRHDEGRGAYTAFGAWGTFDAKYLARSRTMRGHAQLGVPLSSKNRRGRQAQAMGEFEARPLVGQARVTLAASW